MLRACFHIHFPQTGFANRGPSLIFRRVLVSTSVLGAPWRPFVASLCGFPSCPEASLVPRGFSCLPVAFRCPGASLVPRGFLLWLPFAASFCGFPSCPEASLVPRGFPCPPVAYRCIGASMASRGFPLWLPGGGVGAPWRPFVASRCPGASLVPLGFPLRLPHVPGRPWCPVSSLCGFPF